MTGANEAHCCFQVAASSCLAAALSNYLFLIFRSSTSSSLSFSAFSTKYSSGIRCASSHHDSFLIPILDFSFPFVFQCLECLEPNCFSTSFSWLAFVFFSALWRRIFFCGASVANEQQHKQDLRGIYRREYEFSNSPLFTTMHCI